MKVSLNSSAISRQLRLSNEKLFTQLQRVIMQTLQFWAGSAKRVQSYLGCVTEMTNATNYTVPYEYYLDYFDLPPVDASNLKANRYSVVIGFWIGLVSFVAFLFFILFYMSRSGRTSMKTGGFKKFPWNYSETIHQNLVNNDTVRTSIDNQGEEIEGLCSNDSLPCHHMDNSV